MTAPGASSVGGSSSPGIREYRSGSPGKRRTVAQDALRAVAARLEAHHDEVMEIVKDIMAERPERAWPGVESCPVNCPGEIRDGVWVHSWDCTTAIIRIDDGKTEADWRCPHGCKPLPVSLGWTHPHDCPYWSHSNGTPF